MIRAFLKESFDTTVTSAQSRQRLQTPAKVPKEEQRAFAQSKVPIKSQHASSSSTKKNSWEVDCSIASKDCNGMENCDVTPTVGDSEGRHSPSQKAHPTNGNAEFIKIRNFHRSFLKPIRSVVSPSNIDIGINEKVRQETSRDIKQGPQNVSGCPLVAQQGCP
jgi:hypothetical protein